MKPNAQKNTGLIVLQFISLLAIAFAILFVPVSKDNYAYKRSLFDPLLIYPSESGSSDKDTKSLSLDLKQPIHLLTSESPFRSHIDAHWEEIDRQSNDKPSYSEDIVTLLTDKIEIAIWSPRTDANLSVVLSGSNCTTITGHTKEDDYRESETIIKSCGYPHILGIGAFRTDEDIGFVLTDKEGDSHLFSKSLRDPRYQKLAKSPISLTLTNLDLEPSSGKFYLSNSLLALAGTGNYYAFAKPGIGSLITRFIGILAIVTCLMTIRRESRIAINPSLLRPILKHWKPAILLTFSVILLIISISLMLGQLGRSAFDTYTFQVNSYIASTGGIAAIYPGADSATTAWALGGDPQFSASMRYPPMHGYIFLFFGKLGQLFSVFEEQSLPSNNLELLFRIAGGMIHTALSILVFVIASKLTTSRNFAIFSALVVLLNPLLLLGNIAWVQSDIYQIFVLLLGLSATFIWKKPTLGWTFILISLLLKPTPMILLPIVAALSTKIFGVKTTVTSLVKSVIFSTAILMPFWWNGYHMKMIYLPLFKRAFLEGESWNMISMDSYNLWTLASGLTNSFGIDRMLSSSSVGHEIYFGGYSIVLNALLAGRILTAITIMIFIFIVAQSPKLQPTSIFFILGAFSTIIVVLSTGMSARYFAYPIVLLAISVACSFPHRAFPLILITLLTSVSTVSILGVFSLLATELPQILHDRTILRGSSAEVIANFWINDLTITILSIVVICCIPIIATAIHSMQKRQENA